MDACSQSNHCTWVAKTHFIDYIKQVFLGEVIEGQTWVDEMKRSTALRKYEFINQRGEIVAKAETNWVFINTETQRIQRVLAEVREDFERFRSSEYNEAADLLNSDEPSLQDACHYRIKNLYNTVMHPPQHRLNQPIA